MIEQDINVVKEKTTLLQNTNPSDVFRFAADTFEHAMANKLFYMRIDGVELHADRVRIVDLSNGSIRDRDAIHHVVVHKCTHRIVK